MSKNKLLSKKWVKDVENDWSLTSNGIIIHVHKDWDIYDLWTWSITLDYGYEFHTDCRFTRAWDARRSAERFFKQMKKLEL